MFSPYNGQAVTTAASVVTAVGQSGLFIQTPEADSDGNPETSDGLYVYTGSRQSVQVGDLVEVNGTVQEYYDLTEISDHPTITVLGSGEPLPMPVAFSADLPSPNQPQPSNELERFEGMLVEVSTGTVTGPTDQYGIFTVVARPDRSYREPGILYPGLQGLPVWDGNPEVLEVDPDALGLEDSSVNAGARVSQLVGPLTYSFGHYQVWPVTLTIGTASLPRPVRRRKPGELIVATQNLERLADDHDDPNTDDPVLSAQELEVRLDKLSQWTANVLRAPDVLAVQEVENIATLQLLADRINSEDTSLVYTPYLIEGRDPSGIDVGFLFRDTVAVDAVEQLGADAQFTFNARTYDTFDRPPLLARCSYIANGEPFTFTLIDVHLRSLLGIEEANAEFVRRKRYEQAVWLSGTIQQLQQSEPGIRLVVLGDFNAFQFTDGYVDVLGQVSGNPDPRGALLPATDLVDPNLVNLVSSLAEGEAYSFVNDGTAEDLDHVLVSGSLLQWVRGIAFSRGNADASQALALDPSTLLRSSDHDGLVMYLMTDRDGDGTPDDREQEGRIPHRARLLIRPSAGR